MEVMISLLITTFCMALALMIILNIQKNTLPFFKLKSFELCNHYMNRSMEERDVTDAVFPEDGFTVKRIVRSHDEFPDCVLIRIVVFDQSKKVLQEAEAVRYNFSK